jgi:hypothetical protein
MPRKKTARKSRSPITPALHLMVNEAPELFAYSPDNDGTCPCLSRTAEDAAEGYPDGVVVAVYEFSRFERLGTVKPTVSREVVE